MQSVSLYIDLQPSALSLWDDVTPVNYTAYITSHRPTTRWPLLPVYCIHLQAVPSPVYSPQGKVINGKPWGNSPQQTGIPVIHEKLRTSVGNSTCSYKSRSTHRFCESSCSIFRWTAKLGQLDEFPVQLHFNYYWCVLSSELTRCHITFAAWWWRLRWWIDDDDDMTMWDNDLMMIKKAWWQDVCDWQWRDDDHDNDVMMIMTMAWWWSWLRHDDDHDNGVIMIMIMTWWWSWQWRDDDHDNGVMMIMIMTITLRHNNKVFWSCMLVDSYSVYVFVHWEIREEKWLFTGACSASIVLRKEGRSFRSCNQHAFCISAGKNDSW